MRAIVEKRIIDYKLNRENRELTGIEPAKLPFKVVVNNYRQQEKEITDKIDVTLIKRCLPARLDYRPNQPGILNTRNMIVSD